jgi:hypothetical protein
MGLQQDIVQGRDYCGNPTAGGSDPYVERALSVTAGPEQPTSNALTGTLTGLARITLDLGGAGLTSRSALTATLTADVPGQVLLTGLVNGHYTVSEAGARRTATVRNGSMVLRTAAGENAYAITPQR